MNVTLIQMDIVWGDIAANCQTASGAIDSAPGSDLYILPEMWSTGFATEPESIADDSLQSLKWMQQKADSINAAIAGSVATKCDDGTYRNRFYFVMPQSATAIGDVQSATATGAVPSVPYYDKHHLFTYGNEHHRYTAGKERVIVEWRGVRFLLQICYDLRFPTYARNTGCAYDAAIYIASWPKSRIAPWRALLKARAIENQCYVLAVDRIGTDPVCDYCGGTEAIDAYGRTVAACPDDVASVITVAIDMEKLTAFRKKFPVLNDAD